MLVVSTLPLAALSGQAPPIKIGAEVVRAMGAKDPNWNRKLSFVQRAIFADGRPELAGGWIGTEVLFVPGGNEYFREIYRDWRVNEAPTEELFESGAWKRAGWIPR